MTAAHAAVDKGFLAAGVPSELVDEVLGTFLEAKRRFHLDDHRPSQIEGGRFSEAVFRVLQWTANDGQYVPLGKTLPSVDKLMASLANTQANDSVRLHIPRTLRLIYDIRNKRDVAHLADGIDPNLQDASLVIHNMEWVLAELVRQFHDYSAADAHRIISELVSKEVPLIQVFDGHPRILRQLRASDHVLVLLYWRGGQGATLPELMAWARPAMRGNLRRTLAQLDARDLLHLAGGRYLLTRLGERAVEERRLMAPA